ncbi:MAG: hypothetical protein M5U14_04815 [Acidimicrobiia bacterium]|nr:hypothetical protein [Acidimicrobiia bacterium]
MATEHDTSTTTDPEADDLGEAGKRALDAERRARRDAERRSVSFGPGSRSWRRQSCDATSRPRRASRPSRLDA